MPGGARWWRRVLIFGKKRRNADEYQNRGQEHAALEEAGLDWALHHLLFHRYIHSGHFPQARKVGWYVDL